MKYLLEYRSDLKHINLKDLNCEYFSIGASNKKTGNLMTLTNNEEWPFISKKNNLLCNDKMIYSVTNSNKSLFYLSSFDYSSSFFRDIKKFRKTYERSKEVGLVIHLNENTRFALSFASNNKKFIEKDFFKKNAKKIIKIVSESFEIANEQLILSDIFWSEKPYDFYNSNIFNAICNDDRIRNG